VKANLVAWSSTATMSVRHGRPGITTENIAGCGIYAENWRGIED
jgi:hypothetical protein